MSNTLLAIEALNALLTFSMNAMVAAQEYTNLINRTRLEGREPTGEELAALRASSRALTESVLAKLD